jgi:spermidine/putrescine transport system permease protein
VKRFKSLIAITPIYIFTILTVIFPLGYVFALSFLTKGEMFGYTWDFTWENYRRVVSGLYVDVFLESGKIGILTTFITLVIAYPFAFIMAHKPARRRSLLMMLVIIPFWTSALLRTYGWMILLRNRGIINNVLLFLGITGEPLSLLYNRGAILLGMAYSLLPFMILPIYTSLEKLDGSIESAARDLGANRFKAFLTITLPLSLPGVLTGGVLVFVPAIGMFFIADLLGGGMGLLLGNLIHNQLTISRDWPFGAALSMIMVTLTFFTMGMYRKYIGGELGVF